MALSSSTALSSRMGTSSGGYCHEGACWCDTKGPIWMGMWYWCCWWGYGGGQAPVGLMGSSWKARFGATKSLLRPCAVHWEGTVAVPAPPKGHVPLHAPELLGRDLDSQPWHLLHPCGGTREQSRDNAQAGWWMKQVTKPLNDSHAEYFF